MKKKVVQIEIGSISIGDEVTPLFIGRTPNPKDDLFCTTHTSDLITWLLS